MKRHIRMETLTDTQFEAALKAVEADDATPEEKAEMLMEIAMGLQQRPKTPREIEDAIRLYDKALDLCPNSAVLLQARINARQATAYQGLPSGTKEDLFTAQDKFNAALRTFNEFELKEEAAETELNLGLVSQALAQIGFGRLQDAIAHYHNALRVFNKEDHPQDYAVLHNNLAIAYLSIPMSDERGKMSEALAVQSFEEVLKVINIVDHPSEYAMIQNNLGNALQYASSSHVFENNLRALEAYEEALRVRNSRDTPLEYANTIANKANVLRNIPDDPNAPADGNRENLKAARKLYVEARDIFERFGRYDGVQQLSEVLSEIEEALGAANAAGTIG